MLARRCDLLQLVAHLGLDVLSQLGFGTLNLTLLILLE